MWLVWLAWSVWWWSSCTRVGEPKETKTDDDDDYDDDDYDDDGTRTSSHDMNAG